MMRERESKYARGSVHTASEYLSTTSLSTSLPLAFHPSSLSFENSFFVPGKHKRTPMKNAPQNDARAGIQVREGFSAYCIKTHLFSTTSQYLSLSHTTIRFSPLIPFFGILFFVPGKHKRTPIKNAPQDDARVGIQEREGSSAYCIRIPSLHYISQYLSIIRFLPLIPFF
jgi:hypothetical protein